MFIPFMGAVIALKEAPRNAWVEAVVGMGGPLLGGVAALLTGAIYFITGNPLFLVLGYTGAFLVRSADGGVVAEADTAEIVDRMLGVLAAGVTSLSRMEEVEAASASSSAAPRAAPRPHPFEFVHDAELRPVLERALAASGDALERGEFSLALILSCGVIDALLTDALDHAQARDHKTPAGLAHRSLGGGGSFETRIAAAERAGLIGGGCARLPPVARTYRDLTDADGELRADAQVSQRDARLARQVLHVVLRDLDPGR